MAKLIIAIMGTALIVAGGFYFLSPKLEPEAPASTSACLSNVECGRACVAIVELQMKRIRSAQRIDEKEYDMIVKDSRDACEYACEAVKNK